MTDQQLFDCLTKGLDIDSISKVFGLSKSTVHLRIKRIKKKLADDEESPRGQ